MSRLYAPTKSSLAKARDENAHRRDVKLGSFEEDLVASPKASRRMPSRGSSPFSPHTSIASSPHRQAASTAASEYRRSRDSSITPPSGAARAGRPSKLVSSHSSEFSVGSAARRSIARSKSQEGLPPSPLSIASEQSFAGAVTSLTADLPEAESSSQNARSRLASVARDSRSASSSTKAAASAPSRPQHERTTSSSSRDERALNSSDPGPGQRRARRRSDSAIAEPSKRKERVSELADRLQGLLQLQEGSPVSVLDPVSRSQSQETADSDSPKHETGTHAARLTPSASSQSSSSSATHKTRRATAVSDQAISDTHRSHSHSHSQSSSHSHSQSHGHAQAHGYSKGQSQGPSPSHSHSRQRAAPQKRPPPPDLALLDSAALVEAVGAAHVEGMQQDLEYVRHVLLASSFAAQPAPAPPPLRLLDQPLDPAVFDRLESELAAVAGWGRVEESDSVSSEEVRVRESTAEERRQRRLLFDAVNEALGRCLVPHAPSPLQRVAFSAQRLPMAGQPAGVELLRAVWREIHDWPVATSDDVYDILDDAARRDMTRGADKWSAEQMAEAEVVSVVQEVEEELVEGVLTELGEEWTRWVVVWEERRRQREEERARRQALKQARLQLEKEQREAQAAKEQQGGGGEAAAGPAGKTVGKEGEKKGGSRPTTPRPLRSQGTPTRSPMMGSNGANVGMGGRRSSIGGAAFPAATAAGGRRSLDKAWLRADGKAGMVSPRVGGVRPSSPISTGGVGRKETL